MDKKLTRFTDVLSDVDEIANSQPLSLPSSHESTAEAQGFASSFRSEVENTIVQLVKTRPPKHTGQHGEFRSIEEIDPKYRHIFTYPYFNLVQSSVIEDALYSDKSMVVCAPTGSGKTVVFEMAIVQLLMQLEDKNYTGDFKIIYMAPVKALCAERLSEWYPKFTKLGLMCIEVTGDTDVDFSQIKPYRIIVTTPEKWDMLTRRWRDHRGLADVIKLFLIDEVHILNDETRGPVLEAVVSRMKTVEESQQAAYRIEQLQKQYNNSSASTSTATQAVGNPPRIRFVAVSATVSNPEDVAAWLGTSDMPAVYYKFGDECRPVKLKRVVEGYPCPDGMSIFKFDIILNYKLWPVIQKYHDGKPTLIFCNTRKSVALTAETLSRELTINFTPEQKAKLTALASTIKNKKLQALVLNGVGCHHAGLLYEERLHIEEAFRNRDLPILITTTTLAMGVNLPAHLVIIKNTQQYVNGQYQEYSISTVLQMVGRAGRPQFDTEATAVIMTRLADKSRYQALVGGDEPLQSYLHKRLPENLNSEAALGTVGDVAQCVQWLRSTFLSVRAAKDPRRYLGLAPNAPPALISKKIEELCVKAMNGLASAGLITMDEVSCIESTEAGRLMSIFYLDLETMKQIMKIEGNETLDKLLWIVCECHELSDMHLRVDERRTLNALNRNNAAATIRFPMKGKINTRQMKLNCIIQAILGCLPIPDPSLNQEAMKVMRIADRICKCLVAYVTRSDLISAQPQYFAAVLNSIILAKCVAAHMWENSPYVSRQLRGIGPTFSTLLASAGKINFTLLEESHPRDLERIMNKGAPAGNVLRKQVSLLPRYQLTATPLDESRVSVQLVLINQNHLAENRDNLTAGDAHKCYIIAGDSENHLLYFSSFKDKDLIGVYDGSITLEITRKHRFQHNVFVHCISSNWVGLDVKCDYLFKSIEPSFIRAEAIHPMPVDEIPKKTTKKQTSITDTYKERKRKTNELNITQSKEKKKRETALIEQFKVLKNSFEETSKELKEGRSKSAQVSNQCIHNITRGDDWGNTFIDAAMGDIHDNFPVIEMGINGFNNTNDSLEVKQCDICPYEDTEDLNDADTLVVDDRIDSILNDIETEICKFKASSELPKTVQSSFFVEHSPNNTKLQPTSNRFPKLNAFKYSANDGIKRKIANNKSNFSFIETIEKKANLNQTTDNISQNDSGFSDTIKSQIQKFLQGTSNKKNHSDTDIYELLKPVKNLHTETREEPKLKHNESKNRIIEANTKMLSTELPAVCLHSRDTITNQPPYKNHDERTDINTQTAHSDTVSNLHKKGNYDKITDLKIQNEHNDSILNLHKETNYDKNTDIKTQTEHSGAVLELHKKANSDTNDKYCYNLKTINYNDKEVAIDADKIETHNDDHVGDTVDENARNSIPIVIETVENKIQKERYNATDQFVLNNLIGKEYADHLENDTENKELLIDDSKARENTATYKASKHHMITDKEFENHFEEDIKSVEKLIKRKKDYENEILLDSTNNSQSEISLKNLKPLPINNLLTNQLTGTKLALQFPSDVSKCETNVTRFKKPTFKPPLKQTTTKKAALTFTGQETNECMENSNSFTKKEQSTQKNTSNTCERRQIANSLQECNHTMKPQYYNERKPFLYKNQYSFSATKIDVCTKTMPDHKVQIIRKVKLDLDVTEIVSKEENMNQAETKHDNANIEKTQQSYCNQPESSSSSDALLPSTTNFGVNKQIRNIEGPSSDMISFKVDHKNNSNDKIFTPELEGNSGKLLSLPVYGKIQAESKEENERKHKYVNINEKQHSIDNNIDINPDCRLPSITASLEVDNDNQRMEDFKNDLFPTNIHHRFSRRKNVAEPECTDENDHNKNSSKEIKNEDQEMKSISTKENKNILHAPETKKKIGNIFQKYSVLLRKNSNINNVENKIFQDNIIKQPTAKTKRTYKINDIHNLEIPVPKSLIAVEARRTPRPSNNDISKIKDKEPGTDNLKNMYAVNESTDIFKIRDTNSSKYTSGEITKINALEKNKVTDLESSPPPPSIHDTGNEQYLDDIKNDLHKEIADYLSPVDDVPNLDPMEEFDLDQSMLNPKTLLQQCFSKEEDIIIPPPSGFCDNDGDYSSTQVDEVLDFPYQGFNETYENMTSEIESRSIVENNTHSILTPSKEIETWTFSQDDDSEADSCRFQIHKNGIPIRSCTVKRSNSPTREHLYSPQQSNRTRLGQFKFKHNKKLTL